jgi:hypothetical protein
VDSSGQIYVSGTTASTDFPTVNPLQPALSGVADIFIARFDRTGSALSYSTYLGGSGIDSGTGMLVTPHGRIYVVGNSRSLDFPTVDAVQPIPDSPFADSSNTVLALLDRTGSSLIHSTYLGGSDNDFGSAMALDARGNVYVAGGTASLDHPITRGAFQKENRGNMESFIVKIGAPSQRRHDATDEDEKDEDAGERH